MYLPLRHDALLTTRTSSPASTLGCGCFPLLLLLVLAFLNSPYLRARFLPGTVLRAPRLVRAFVRVRWPRAGKLRRWRRPR